MHSFQEQTLALRKEGIGVVLDSELPHLIGIDDDLLSTGIILYHLKEGQTHVGREDAVTEQDIGKKNTIIFWEDLSQNWQISAFGVTIHVETMHYFFLQGAVILLGRTNMFRFNHPKEAARLREKRKSGLLSSFSLSMSDLSKSCENLSAVMLYNPGLEFERQQREELEKLESKRKLIEEMEEKQKSDKAELERMQQEVESQRKETEIVQLQIRKQEENLKRTSFHIENRMKDLLAEKERFEEERLREQQEIELQKKKQQEEIFARVKEELQRLQELSENEKAEKMQIFRALEKLKKEKEEQYIKLESEKRRLDEQERDQVMLVAHLEEQFRDKQVMVQLLKRGDVQRVEEEMKGLEDIRESLLRVKEARSESDEDTEELEKAQYNFMDFKEKQLEHLISLERDLIQQRDQLKKEVTDEHENLERLKHAQFLRLERNDENTSDAALGVEECNKIKSGEYRLQHKERQLQYLLNNHLPSLLEEKQRASEVLDRGLQSLDNTLYEVEKEMEEKEEQLAQYRTSANELQQLQETFEFTANVARQEEKVRKKEKEILESRQKQQREALEQAVAKLERRHSALQRRSTIGTEIEEQKQKLANLNSSSSEQAGLHATLEAERQALEEDRERLDLQIQQLKQKICEGNEVEKELLGSVEERLSHSSSPSHSTKSQSPFIPLADGRINAFIEEEVQRRLQNIHGTSGANNNNLLQTTEVIKDNEKFHNGTVQRKLKYEKRQPWFPLYGFLAVSNDDSQCYDLIGEDTGIADISKQDKSIDTFNPNWERTLQFYTTQEATKLLASAKHEPGFCFSLSLGKQNDQVPQVCEQIPNGQLNEKAKNATQKCPPESEVKKSYNLGHLFSKFSSIYSDTSCQVFKKSWFSKQIKDLVSLCEKNAQGASLIKSLPFIKKMQLNSYSGGKNESHLEDEIRTFDANISPRRLVHKGDTTTSLSSKASVNVCATDHFERMICRSVKINPDDLKNPVKISIPRYVLCGQGKDEHYEYEIKITVLDETWTVFRRYSRFREMHQTLKLKYPEVS
ncbi:hypothetical protein lerEdw1_018565 [Lerista edwardsae]|nr:hypothetical protein lerEdw1_018565 [Lerista edwardsae]